MTARELTNCSCGYRQQINKTKQEKQKSNPKKKDQKKKKKPSKQFH
jgi:hypothetical protein